MPFSDHINNTPKLVASRTLDKVEWRNSSLIRGNVVDALNTLKQLPGRNISMIGSATLVRSLLQDDVLDELRLLVHPIVVARGKKLFEGDVQKKLKLVESKTFQTGVVTSHIPTGVRAGVSFYRLSSVGTTGTAGPRNVLALVIFFTLRPKR